MPALPFRKHLRRRRWKSYRVLDINVRGVFIATQAALKHMKSGGRIIMIGSSVGERVLVPGLVPYAATKGAVKMFTQGHNPLIRSWTCTPTAGAEHDQRA